MQTMAALVGLAGSGFQLVGTLLTLWGVLSAPSTARQRAIALIGALFGTKARAVAAKLSDLNEDDRIRILRGLALLAAGYVLAVISQILLVAVSA